MKKTNVLRVTVGFFMIALMVSCKQESKEDKESEDVSLAFNTLLDAYYEEGLKLNPLDATFQGDNRYNDQLPNFISEAHRAKSKAYIEKYKKQLETIDDEGLSDGEKMAKASFEWDLDMQLRAQDFKDHLMPINQFASFNLMFGQLAGGKSAQPFNTVEDYENWLKRLDAYVEWMSTAEANMRQGMQEGYVLPKSLIIKTLPQLKAMTHENVEEHLFYAPIKQMGDDFSEQEKTLLSEAYHKMVTEKIIPAYKSMYDFMKLEYLEAGRETSGIKAIPNGEAYYNHLIKANTTTDMTADEIHELGLLEVARISSEMEKVKEQVGFKGSLKEFFDHVRTNKELMPFTEPQQVIDNFYAIHERMKPQLEKLFGNKPKTPFEVRRVEAFREASASAHYDPGSLDGTRPGIFYTPIRNVKAYNTYSDETLFLHEAIPGHHYQVSLVQEDEDLPKYIKTNSYTVYDEGWGLYAESLGKELGLYTDPFQYFGNLDAEMHRAIRLVVDTGLHSKGWTREQAIQYSLDNEATSEDDIISEIERYMVIPGQALSYKIGQLKLLELRAKAEQQLGDKFDIKEFHDQILQTGSIPMFLLEKRINEWIKATDKN